VFVSEEVIPQEGVVNEALEHDVEEARLPQVDEPASALTWEEVGVLKCGGIFVGGRPWFEGFPQVLRL
jgi:hypothetical protein